MIISAISANSCYAMSKSNPYYVRKISEIDDTSFNSLTPLSNKKKVAEDKLPQLYDNINEWQNFCHKQILGQKLNVIA